MGRNSKYQHFSNALLIPPTSKRATVKIKTNRTVTLTGWLNHLHDNYDLNHSQIGNVLEKTTLLSEGTLDELAYHITTASAIGVCDGSYDKSHQTGSAAQIIDISTGSSKAPWGDITPGDKDIQNLYQSELFG